jgi:hypothetical protein
MSHGQRLDQLTELYNQPGPFATAYVEVSRDAESGNQVAELAAREAADALLALGAPEQVAASIRDGLSRSTHQPAPVSRCLVASASGVLLDRLTRSHRPQPLTTWAPLPDLAPWLADLQQTRPFVLALVDREGGDVTSYSADGMVPTDESSVGEPSPYVHKVRSGGWSQLRYQHTSENVWRANAGEVAREIERQVRTGPDLVVLAGDVKARSGVRDQLSSTMTAELVELDHGGRAVDGGDDALAAAVQSVIDDRVVSTTLAAVHELRDRMGQDRAVAVGVRDVTDAFVRGQVDTLLLDPEAARAFEVRPVDHPGLVLGAAIGDEPVRADLAVVAAACLTDAEVLISRASTLGGATVAALLRWDQTAQGTGA